MNAFLFALVVFSVFTACLGGPNNLEAALSCYWSGTAPACEGTCETGQFVARTDLSGDGKKCATGTKMYCCKLLPQWIAQLPADFAKGHLSGSDFDGIFKPVKPINPQPFLG